MCQPGTRSVHHVAADWQCSAASSPSSMWLLCGSALLHLGHTPCGCCLAVLCCTQFVLHVGVLQCSAASSPSSMWLLCGSARLATVTCASPLTHAFSDPPPTTLAASVRIHGTCYYVINIDLRSKKMRIGTFSKLAYWHVSKLAYWHVFEPALSLSPSVVLTLTRECPFGP
jgi:hypothetical protein